MSKRQCQSALFIREYPTFIREYPTFIREYPLISNECIVSAPMHDECSSELLAKDIGHVLSKEQIEKIIKIIESTLVELMENKNV
jgi:hypothetical protein